MGDQPRVAFLSYSTKGSAAGPSVAKMQEAAALFRALAPNIPPTASSRAMPPWCQRSASGRRPAHRSPGAANILVFPDLDAGNIAYKLVQRLGGAVALGPLLQGLARPMSDLSRGATVDDIVEVAAMVALQCDGARRPDQENGWASVSARPRPA